MLGEPHSPTSGSKTVVPPMSGITSRGKMKDDAEIRKLADLDSIITNKMDNSDLKF